MFFFFFKQKTAYEMRTSDWSSDVCSSDLCQSYRQTGSSTAFETISLSPCARAAYSNIPLISSGASCINPRNMLHPSSPHCGEEGCSMLRSEEHTSELQSLMRISYAVFCLKKKNTHNPISTPDTVTKSISNILHGIKQSTTHTH